MMDWQNQNQTHQQQQMEPPNGFGGLFVKVMTDEQMELLRRQISVYASICEKLVEMHKAISTQQDLTGMRLGNLYCDPLMISGGHKISARQRWTPTPVQLQILERIFDEGNGTPSKQKIKEITNELTQHGPISETNVYNWFQNRRARSKRKLTVSVANNAESEVETDVESPKEKAKMENIQSHENSASRIESLYLQSHEINADMFGFDGHHSKGEPIFLSDSSLRPSGSFEHLSMMPNLRLDHLTGEMDVPASYSPYFNGEGYDDMVG